MTLVNHLPRMLRVLLLLLLVRLQCEVKTFSKPLSLRASLGTDQRFCAILQARCTQFPNVPKCRNAASQKLYRVRGGRPFLFPLGIAAASLGASSRADLQRMVRRRRITAIGSRWLAACLGRVDSCRQIILAASWVVVSFAPSGVSKNRCQSINSIDH